MVVDRVCRPRERKYDLEQAQNVFMFLCLGFLGRLGGLPAAALVSVAVGRHVLLRLIVVVWIVAWLGLLVRPGEVVPVDEPENEQPDNASSDDRLHVLHPELVFQFSRAFLKLAGAILQRICFLVELIELLVALQHLFDVVAHDVDNFVDLGLLLGHPFLSHDLLHLRRAGQRLAVGTERTAIWTDGRLCLSLFYVGHFMQFNLVDRGAQYTR